MINEKINDTDIYDVNMINSTDKNIINKDVKTDSSFKKQICIKAFDYMFF